MGSEQLPHLNIEENPTVPNKKKVFLIAVFSFLLLSLPLSVYLVGRQQQISSQASNPVTPILEKSITLSSESKVVGQGQTIPVDVLIRSDQEKVNLAVVKITFNPSKVKVVDLVTNSAESGERVFFGKYWLSKGFDNEKGEISLIAGTPAPGVETALGSPAYLLAQLKFVTLSEGEADISLQSDSAIYSDILNQPVGGILNSLNLTIQQNAALPGSGSNTATSNLPVRYSEMQPSSSIPDQLFQTSPTAGEVFFYFRPIEVRWSGSPRQIKSLVLYLNNEPYGIVAENLANNGSYSWTPSLSIPLPMIVPENTYSFQFIYQNQNQSEIRSEHSIPFGIISDPNGQVTQAGFQVKSADNLTVLSASNIFSKWGQLLTQESEFDLNNDLVINYLDLYLLRKALFVKDLVY